MSWQMRAVAAYVRMTRRPRMATAERARARIAEAKGSPGPPGRLTKRHDISRRRVGGFDCYSVTPRDGSPRRAVVYLHGGAYISELAKQHWAFVSALADAGCRVDVPVYGLAPQHTAREAVPFVTAVYEELLETFAPGEVGLAGDSAGGGLALAVTQALPASTPRPGRLVLIAPWLDVTLTNPQVTQVQPHDPWLSAVGLVEAGRAWAGEDDPRHPWVSPLHGEYAGLPPVHVVVGTRDILHPDCLVLQARCAEAGVPCELTVAEGAFHVYPLAPVPEGRREAERLVALLASG